MTRIGRKPDVDPGRSEEINQAGGVPSRPIEPVAYDPGSDETEYGRLTNLLLADDVRRQASTANAISVT
jgi:hypothetical protein